MVGIDRPLCLPCGAPLPPSTAGEADDHGVVGQPGICTERTPVMGSGGAGVATKSAVGRPTGMAYATRRDIRVRLERVMRRG